LHAGAGRRRAGGGQVQGPRRDEAPPAARSGPRRGAPGRPEAWPPAPGGASWRASLEKRLAGHSPALLLQVPTGSRGIKAKKAR